LIENAISLVFIVKKNLMWIAFSVQQIWIKEL